MQPAAALLAGDCLRIEVTLGAGARLDLLEVAATIAHPSRGGPPAGLEITVHAGPNATLAWDAKPLILCAGCEVHRSVELELETGAVVLLRDTLVFGRAAEQPGVFATRTVATYEGSPLHHEALDSTDVATFRSPAVLGRARVLDSVALYGARCQEPGVLQLAGPGSLLVIPAEDAADARAIADSAFRRWRAAGAAG